MPIDQHPIETPFPGNPRLCQADSANHYKCYAAGKKPATKDNMLQDSVY